ncbi:hypothetical protein IWZ01DRAFT_479728 [Phyllosticta capitalensis]
MATLNRAWVNSSPSQLELVSCPKPSSGPGQVSSDPARRDLAQFQRRHGDQPLPQVPKNRNRVQLGVAGPHRHARAAAPDDVDGGGRPVGNLRMESVLGWAAATSTVPCRSVWWSTTRCVCALLQLPGWRHVEGKSDYDADVRLASSGRRKLDFAKKSAEELRLMNGKGVDHVIEVGGSSTIEQSLKSVPDGGLVTVLGVLTFGGKTDLIPLIVPGGKSRIRGQANIACAQSEASLVLGANEEMNSRFVEFIEEHDIRPVIASTFLFDGAPQALARLEKQREIGKIVIKIEN